MPAPNAPETAHLFSANEQGRWQISASAVQKQLLYSDLLFRLL